jgi:hypothetical protein
MLDSARTVDLLLVNQKSHASWLSHVVQDAGCLFFVPRGSTRRIGLPRSRPGFRAPGRSIFTSFPLNVAESIEQVGGPLATSAHLIGRI